MSLEARASLEAKTSHFLYKVQYQTLERYDVLRTYELYTFISSLRDLPIGVPPATDGQSGTNSGLVL